MRSTFNVQLNLHLCFDFNTYSKINAYSHSHLNYVKRYVFFIHSDIWRFFPFEMCKNKKANKKQLNFYVLFSSGTWLMVRLFSCWPQLLIIHHQPIFFQFCLEFQLFNLRILYKTSTYLAITTINRPKRVVFAKRKRCKPKMLKKKNVDVKWFWKPI